MRELEYYNKLREVLFKNARVLLDNARAIQAEDETQIEAAMFAVTCALAHTQAAKAIGELLDAIQARDVSAFAMAEESREQADDHKQAIRALGTRISDMTGDMVMLRQRVAVQEIQLRAIKDQRDIAKRRLEDLSNELAERAREVDKPMIDPGKNI